MTSTPIADMTAGRKLTRRYRIVGMNIKGTPPMNGKRVEHDLRVARDDYDAQVIVTQETRWRWYFRKVGKILKPRRKTPTSKPRAGATWAHEPRLARALAAPVFAAQAVFWRSDQLKRRKVERRRLHRGAAKISESRQLRGVLLQDLEHRDDPDMAWWNGTTHFVVGADRAGDGQTRQDILYDQDLPNFDRWLGAMLATGHGAVVQLDANIARGSAAYDDLLRVVRRHGGRIVGRHGVEYLIVFQPSNGTRIDVLDTWEIPTSKLETDHEGRGLTMRLRKPAGRQ